MILGYSFLFLPDGNDCAVLKMVRYLLRNNVPADFAVLENGTAFRVKDVDLDKLPWDETDDDNCPFIPVSDGAYEDEEKGGHGLYETGIDPVVEWPGMVWTSIVRNGKYD